MRILKKVKPPKIIMKSRGTVVSTPDIVKSNGGRASSKKVIANLKESKKINLIKNYFSPVFAREPSLPTDKIKNDNFSTKFTLMQGQVLPLNLDQKDGKVSIHKPQYNHCSRTTTNSSTDHTRRHCTDQ